MRITTLFGVEEIKEPPKPIRLKTIKAVYVTLTIREEITDYD